MADSRPAAPRPSPLRPTSSPPFQVPSRAALRLALGRRADELRRIDRRIVAAVAAVSLAILAAAVHTGTEVAASALVAALWIRVGADAIARDEDAPPPVSR